MSPSVSVASRQELAHKKYPCMQIFSFLALLVFPINSGQTHKHTHTHTHIQQSSFNSIDISTEFSTKF